MKTYLSLIPISAKVHKRRNRMTLLCIIIAVFLVTAIFSMVDMMVRMETRHAVDIHGSWHIMLSGLSESQAEEIRSRSDIAAASWYDVINPDMDRDYHINGRKTALCGIDEAFITDIMNYFTQDSSLQSDDEIILSANAKKLLDIDIGSRITLNTPSGHYEFTISGFRSDDDRYTSSNGGETTALLVEDDEIGAFMTISAFQKITGSDKKENSSPGYFIKFKNHTNMKKSIAQLKEQYGLTDKEIERNTIIMGLMGLSDNPYIKNIYPIPVILFILILAAGVLMISGSINSNIVQRSQFFGMLRCIGASRQQIINFVRLEALNWCKTAVPAGIISGMAAAWLLCAILRYGVGGEFIDMTVFGISPAGILCGILMGISAVLIAAQSPAKRAARVSPVSAVTADTEHTKSTGHRVNTRLLKIDTALGIRHATASRKNFILMTGSFALSIILFLSFSVLVELVGYLIPQKSSSPDLSIMSRDLTNTVEQSLMEEISGMKGVKQAASRSTVLDVPAMFSRKTRQKTIDIISYSQCQFQWLVKDKDLRKGSDVSKVYGDSNYVLIIYDKDNTLTTGDKIQTKGEELEIAGLQKYSPFSNDGTTDGRIVMICSEETFMRLTGESDYAIIDVQMTRDATDKDVAAIRKLAGEKYKFVDRRSGGESDRSTYGAFMLFVYGFLATISLITILNIINSISMSVAARIKQYGAMRAVGLDQRQLTKIIAAEAFTYALSGCAAGCAAGLPLNKFLYDFLITAHFNYYTWSIPVKPIILILFLVLAAAAAAVYIPSKRIRTLSITQTVNEL